MHAYKKLKLEHFWVIWKSNKNKWKKNFEYAHNNPLHCFTLSSSIDHPAWYEKKNKEICHEFLILPLFLLLLDIVFNVNISTVRPHSKSKIYRSMLWWIDPCDLGCCVWAFTENIHVYIHRELFVKQFTDETHNSHPPHPSICK